MKYRHIEPGDCAAYPGMAAIRRKRRGRRMVCPRTIQNHIAEMLDAADAAAGGVERRRTRRTNTYVFTLPEQPQKQPEIRAEIADNCYPLSYPVFDPIEPQREEDQDQGQDQEQKNRARDPSTPTTTTTKKAVMTGRATTTTTTKAVMPGTDPGRGPFRIWASKFSAIFRSRPSCSPETSPPARRTPVKAKPVTEAQLEYLAFLADEVGTDRPSPSTLTVRTADRAIQDLKARRALGRERRDCRRRPVPETVQAQTDRTDRTAPIHGCPASARRARIDVLDLSLELWRTRTDPATVQAWEHERAQLTAAAAITEEDRHREGLRPHGSSAAGSPPPPGACEDKQRRPPATHGHPGIMTCGAASTAVSEAPPGQTPPTPPGQTPPTPTSTPPTPPGQTPPTPTSTTPQAPGQTTPPPTPTSTRTRTPPPSAADRAPRGARPSPDGRPGRTPAAAWRAYGRRLHAASPRPSTLSHPPKP